MFKFLLFFFFVALSHAAPSEDGKDLRIVGGSDAPPGSAPFQVALRSVSDTFFCGGTIISPRTILTAGHCLKGHNPINNYAWAGTYSLLIGGDKYRGSKIIVHEDYTAEFLRNDIALLILETPINMTSNVASIPIDTEYIEAGTKVNLTGWGQRSTSGSLAQYLQFISLKVNSHEDCGYRLSSTQWIEKYNLCTLTDEGKGSCEGDDGSPLVADGKLVGIASWRVPCAKGLPDVFTRVSYFADWIKKNMVE